MIDPSEYEEWDEPILARSWPDARRKCQKLSEDYSKDGHLVESLEPEYIPKNAYAKTQQPNFRCRFRS